MADEIETRYFENVPSVGRIMGTHMALEHKRIAVACVRNYEEEVERGELGAEDLDQLMNELKLWIYGFAVTANYSDRNAKRIASIPLAFNIGSRLGEVLVARAPLPEV